MLSYRAQKLQGPPFNLLNKGAGILKKAVFYVIIV